MLSCTPLNHAAAMLKLSGQSDPDPQRYLRQTHTERQTEIPCFYREMCGSVFTESLWTRVRDPNIINAGEDTCPS